MQTKCLGKITQFFRPRRPEVARKMAADSANVPLKKISAVVARETAAKCPDVLIKDTWLQTVVSRWYGTAILQSLFLKMK